MRNSNGRNISGITERGQVPAVTSVLVVVAVTAGAAGGSELGVGGFAASAEEL